MTSHRSLTILLLLVPLSLCAGEAPWVNHTSRAERERPNPFANQPEAIAAGGRLFADHCAKCHGEDAFGRGKRPNLRSKEVQQATDGELFWMLTNGYLRKGMPSWSAIPEPSRWQIVTYIKSLGEAEGKTSPAR
jgi:mono/diheme cytochrome c family protein